MNSILNNSSALSALQALQMTQQSLYTVQNQVSTGLKVATAADNSSYWSIAAQLNADSGVVRAPNDALSQGQSVLSTATSAINSVITTINSIATALTQATRARRRHHRHQHLARLARQAAQRRGQRRLVQWHQRSERQPDHAELRLRLQRDRHRRLASTPSRFTAQALTAARPAGRRPSTTSQSTITDPTMIGELQTQFTADAADTTTAPPELTATYGADAIYEDTANQAIDGPVDGALTAQRRRRPTRRSTPTAIRVAQDGVLDLRDRVRPSRVDDNVTTPDVANLLTQGAST